MQPSSPAEQPAPPRFGPGSGSSPRSVSSPRSGEAGRWADWRAASRRSIPRRPVPGLGLTGGSRQLAGHRLFRQQLRLGRRGLAIGIDIGGTKVAAGVVDAEGNILREARRSTPGSDPRAVERVIVELVEELSAGTRIRSGLYGLYAARSSCVIA